MKMKRKLFNMTGAGLPMAIFAVLLLALVFGLAGCNDPNGGVPGSNDPELAGTIKIQKNGVDATTAETGDTLIAVYNGTETVTYQWNKDGTTVSTSPMFMPSTAGNYTVTVSASGYQSKTSAAVNVTGSTLSALAGTIKIQKNNADVTTASTGDTLTAVYSGSETVSYQWNKDNAPISGADSITFTPSMVGKYTVTVSASGYASKASAEVNVTSGSGSGGASIIGTWTKTHAASELGELAEVPGVSFTSTITYSDTASGGDWEARLFDFVDIVGTWTLNGTVLTMTDDSGEAAWTGTATVTDTTLTISGFQSQPDEDGMGPELLNGTWTRQNGGGGGDATVTSVTVTAADNATTVSKGETLQFSAVVAGTNNPAQTVTWSITTDGIASGTSVSDDGLLTVADDESQTSIEVQATSTVDATKSGKLSVTVLGPAFTITDITITAENGAIPDENERIYMEKNDSLQLSATVTGTGDFAQTVTWSITTDGIALGTSISDDGLLTVARMETKTSLAVRATSTVDPTKFGWRSINFTSRETNLKTRFEITSTGTQGVTATFNAVHAYLQNKTPEEVVSEGKIKVGDYIDLESLSIQGYPTNIEENGSVTIRANQDITPSSLPFPDYQGKLLRLIVVGINSFNANGAFTGNDNGSDAHIVFQFQNIPVKRTMEATLTNANGYLGSQMRTYLLNRFYVGLREAGVPMNDIAWAPKRFVANKGGGEGTTPELIEDKIWLPTEWEMAGTGEYSDPVCETEENQARLEYYTNNSEEDNSKSRAKYNASSARTDYWLATPSKSNTYAFCEIYYYPTSKGNSPNATGATNMEGVAPAFCVK